MDNRVDKNHPLELNYLDEGAMILIDKPLDWTSFDVVNKLRWSIKHFKQVKKYKVGHAGTLDPLASGLLIVCIGKYTKQIDQLSAMDKCYEGVIQLGAETPTYDAESLPDIYFPHKEITNDQLRQVESKFTGDLSQLPPMYSAVKIDGVQLYKLARKGKHIERKPRKISIDQLSLNLASSNTLTFSLKCSKGTYVRSLAYDIGRYLGTGGYLNSLRRTRIGQFSVHSSITIQEFMDDLKRLKPTAP